MAATKRDRVRSFLAKSNIGLVPNFRICILNGIFKVQFPRKKEKIIISRQHNGASHATPVKLCNVKGEVFKYEGENY